jgi:hypothetical protein
MELYRPHVNILHHRTKWSIKSFYQWIRQRNYLVKSTTWLAKLHWCLNFFHVQNFEGDFLHLAQHCNIKSIAENVLPQRWWLTNLSILKIGPVSTLLLIRQRFVNCTMNKTRIYHFTLEAKQESEEWKHPNLPSPMIAKTVNYEFDFLGCWWYYDGRLSTKGTSN